MLRRDQTEWNLFAERLLMGLDQCFDDMGASVGHVKLMIESGDSFLIGNLTGKGAASVDWQGPAPQPG